MIHSHSPQIKTYNVPDVKSRVPFISLFNELFPGRFKPGEKLALCPFHDDHNPSFEVKEDHGVCHAGCVPPGGKEPSWSSIDIWMAAHGCDFGTAIASLADRCGLGPRGKGNGEAHAKRNGDRPPPWERKPAAQYNYTDEAGAYAFTVVRFEDEHVPEGQTKEFSQRRKNPDNGKWKWSLKGMEGPRPLFRLREIAGADTVFIVEGEKDALRLASVGMAATTSAGGKG